MRKIAHHLCTVCLTLWHGHCTQPCSALQTVKECELEDASKQYGFTELTHYLQAASVQTHDAN